MYFTYATQILTYQTGPNLESIWRLGIGQRKNWEDIYGDGKVSLFILMPFFFFLKEFDHHGQRTHDIENF